MNHNPLDAVHGIAGGESRPYYCTALQRSCILARLMRGPVSRPELERLCGAPSVTKRISELRRQGFSIASGWVEVSGPGGTVQVVTVYALEMRDDRQGELFASEAGA
jgi:hypothetical protein